MSKEERILIAPFTRRDGQLTIRLLRDWGMEGEPCYDCATLCREIQEGASCLVVAREFLERESIETLVRCLDKQPAWSHLPIIVLAGSGDLQEADERAICILEPLKNVTVLERPVRLRTLLSVVKAAIADRKRQYETRELLIQLERQNQELEQFSYIASHDLQEPLRMVTSYTQLIEKRLRDHLDEDTRTFIGFVVNGTSRMQRLIKDLLTYAKAGREQCKLQQVDLNKVIAGVLQTLSILLEDTGAQIKVPDSFPMIDGDSTLLTQLFQNLIGNAIKFRKPGVAPLVEIDCFKKESVWIFSIKDNGIGMSQEDLVRIFKPFQRLHPANQYPGSGIGLALCQKIVRLLGGTIRVESAPGEGSVFSFTIPEVRAEEQSEHKALLDSKNAPSNIVYQEITARSAAR